MSRIKVLVVDDSAVVRQVVAALLGRDPGIEVIAAVADPILAIARMNVQWPDVIVLDIEMPRMDGITFLKKNHGRAANTGGDLLDLGREGR